MRAPYQILAIPYRFVENELRFCVFHRADCDMWQFIAGGGEDGETPEITVRREISEEGGIITDNVMRLTSMCYMPTTIFPDIKLYGWPEDTYVVPEYAFAFECNEEITLSHEHTGCVWMRYEQAKDILTWDSNRTALYELMRRLLAK